MLELGSEVAYPVGEGVVSGIMTFFWTLVGIIYLCMFFINRIGYTWMNWTMVAAIIMSIPFVIGIKEIKSQKASGSLRWVWGFLFWVWMKLGKRMGSLVMSSLLIEK